MCEHVDFTPFKGLDGDFLVVESLFDNLADVVHITGYVIGFGEIPAVAL